MIGIDIRELTDLKIFHPICEYFIKHKVPFSVYYYDVGRGSKEYNRASVKNINASSPQILSSAKHARAYNTNANLFSLMQKDGIKKFVSVELFLCYKDIISNLRACGIKTYSILYLTDSVLSMGVGSNAYKVVDRTYFASEFLLNKALEYSDTKYNKTQHVFLGSPLYDQLKGVGSKDIALVMLPNLKAEHIPSAFGSEAKFVKIIEHLAADNHLIFKTRAKQWLPNNIKKFAKDIIFDGTKLYPSSIVGAFGKCNKVVMFYSSGIYEAVAANKLVINIPLPLSRWRWNKTMMNDYFKCTELYDYPGVVMSLEQKDILAGPVKFDTFDSGARDKWIEKFIGNLSFSGAHNIAKDIIA